MKKKKKKKNFDQNLPNDYWKKCHNAINIRFLKVLLAIKNTLRPELKRCQFWKDFLRL